MNPERTECSGSTTPAILLSLAQIAMHSPITRGCNIMSEFIKSKYSRLDLEVPRFFALVLSLSIKRVFQLNLDTILVVLSEENLSITKKISISL
jgi:hypothetical protein